MAAASTHKLFFLHGLAHIEGLLFVLGSLSFPLLGFREGGRGVEEVLVWTIAFRH